MDASTTKMHPQHERISLEGLSPEHFEKLVLLVTNWIRDDFITLRLIVPSQVRLEFKEKNILELLKSNGLPPMCAGQVRDQIPMMIGSILSGQKRLAVRVIMDTTTIPKITGETKPTKEQIREEIEARLQFVEDKIITAELRRQYAIKVSAKNSIYADVFWEVVEKCDDDSEGVLPKLVSATIRIVAQKPLPRGSADFFTPYMFPAIIDSSNELTLTMTLEDLQALSKALANATTAVRRKIEKE